MEIDQPFLSAIWLFRNLVDDRVGNVNSCEFTFAFSKVSPKLEEELTL